MCDNGCGCASNCDCNITALSKGEKGDKGDAGASGTVTVIHEAVEVESSSITFGDGFTVTDLGGGDSLVEYTEDNSVLIANTVFVNKYGNDTTGFVERFDKPFLTITSALSAARTAWNDASRGPAARKRIVVESGDYTETTLYLFPYIDYDLGNINLNTHFTDDFVFPVAPVTYTANPTNDFTVKIFGNAKIKGLGTAYAVNFELTNIDTRLLCQCDEITSTMDDCISMGEASYAKFICNQMWNSNTTSNPQYAHCIQSVQGGYHPGPFTQSTLDIVGADIYQNGNISASTIGIGVGVGDGTTTLKQTLNFYNCRIMNSMGGVEETDNDKFSAIGVGTSGPRQAGTIVNLYNTTLYSKNGKTIYVSNTFAKANVTVNYYTVNSANTDSLNAVPDADHTLVQTMKATGLIIDVNAVPIVP